MNRHDRGVLISIGKILADVFHEELVGRRLHVCVNKRGQIQVGAAVKVELVFDELAHRGTIGAVLRDFEFGDVDSGLIAGTVGEVACMVRGRIVNVGALSRGALIEMAEEFLRVDLDELSH